MSDANALRFALNYVWEILNTPIEWNGFTFSYAQILVLFIAIVIVGLIAKFFA